MPREITLPRPRKITLPAKPSALIRVALDDLAAVEKSKKYHVNMAQYHYPDGLRKCSVCFAGSVMAMTGGASIDKALNPCDFDTVTAGKLYALDHFRGGYIEMGLNSMGLRKPKWLPEEVKITYYSANKRKFKKEMREMASVLEGNGL